MLFTGKGVISMAASIVIDNISDKRWRAISTFPKHLHNGSEENVKESTLSDEPKEALRQFLIFTKRILNKGH